MDFEIVSPEVLINSILGLLGAVLGIIATYVNKKRTKLYNSVKEDTDSQKEFIRMVSKAILMSDATPLDERVNAGSVYVKNGGNGAGEAQYEALKQAMIQQESEHYKFVQEKIYDRKSGK